MQARTKQTVLLIEQLTAAHTVLEEFRSQSLMDDGLRYRQAREALLKARWAIADHLGAGNPAATHHIADRLQAAEDQGRDTADTCVTHQLALDWTDPS